MAAGQNVPEQRGCQAISLHPHPTLPFEQGYKSACVALVSHGCSTDRRGGAGRNHYYVPSELEKSILFFDFI